MSLSGLRPVSAALLVLMTCLFIAVTDNATHFEIAGRVFADAPLSWLRLEIAVFALFYAVAVLFTQRLIVRPVLVVLLISSALAAHLLDRYAFSFDRATIGDMLNTPLNEVPHLLTPALLLDVGVFGILPAIVVMIVPLRRESTLGKFLRAVVISVASLGLCAAALLSDNSRFAAIFSENPRLMESWVPGAPVAGAVSYAKLAMGGRDAPAVAVGRDARPGPYLTHPGKPVVAVLVIGSSSRTASWQLGGYTRPTNPGLSARSDVIWFGDVTSCGTSASVSVPCMLSDLERSEYSRPGAARRDNLLAVLRRAGFDVQWWDNSGTNRRIAQQAVYTDVTTGGPGPECARGTCDDRVLATALESALPQITRDTVIIMQMAGSQGPAYHLRYEPAQAPFEPDCDTSALGDCTHDEIVNSYDNSVAFTDQVLTRMIGDLDAAQNVVPVLLFASDNGESVGENGLYLHSAPWFMAPPEQIHVPMLIWLSPRAPERLGLRDACLRAHSADALSHDNIFPTVLGLLDVATLARDPALDLTAGCRAALAP